MSQRDSGYERKERDLYETPEWVTRALLPALPRTPVKIWEPAAGNGAMARVLATTTSVVSSDVFEHALAYQADFLDAPVHEGVDAIITNPPYNLAAEFCERALRLMEPVGGIVAMLLRTDFDHAKGRTHLFRDCPAFAKKLILMRRIVWFVEDDGKPKASPSYNHAWMIWDWRHEGPATLAWGP